MDPEEVAEVVKGYGRLVVGEKGELMVELDGIEKAEALSHTLRERFEDQIQLAP